MKIQIQIASEGKHSNLASTLAHETRKNNAGRILFLSLCVAVMFAGAAIFTACDNGDKNGDDDVHTAGRKYAAELCACFKMTDPKEGRDCVSALESKSEYEKWWDDVLFEGAVVGALDTNCDVGYPDWWDEIDEPEVTKENFYFEFDLMAAMIEIDAFVIGVQSRLARPEVDTVFLVPNESWKGLNLRFSELATIGLKEVFDCDEDRIWGKGILDPDEISKADSAYLASRKFEIKALSVIAD